jgi:hypothetical protein
MRDGRHSSGDFMGTRVSVGGAVKVLSVMVSVGMTLSACGGGSSKNASTKGSSTTPSKASASTTKPANGGSTNLANGLPSLADIELAVKRSMTTGGPQDLGTDSVLRALCGQTSPPNVASAGSFGQYNSVPQGQALVSVAVQGWGFGKLDPAWQQERTIARNCAPYTSSGFPQVIVDHTEDANGISVTAKNPTSNVTTTDDLRRYNNFVVSVRTTWDPATARTFVVPDTQLAVLNAALGQARKLGIGV